MESTIYFDTQKDSENISKDIGYAVSVLSEINEDIYVLYDYLPVLYKNESENEYFKDTV